jgi:hypothetical protein
VLLVALVQEELQQPRAMLHRKEVERWVLAQSQALGRAGLTKANSRISFQAFLPRLLGAPTPVLWELAGKVQSLLLLRLMEGISQVVVVVQLSSLMRVAVTAILVEEEEEEHTLTHHKTEVPIPVKVGQALLSLKSWASSREGRDEYGKL